MTAAVTVGGRFDAGARRLGYRDPGSGCEVVVTTPSADPQLWEDYLAGAQHSYRAHGVEHALDYEQIRDGQTSSLLFVVRSPDGETIAGMRSQGPYTSADQSHAVAEWAGDPGQPAVRAAVERMLPAGLVETKTAWVAGDRPARRELVSCLCRMPIHAAMVLGARYAMGTAADYSVPGWTATGAVVASDVPQVAYPDDRYRTRLVWWDRFALPSSLLESERQAIDDEATQLRAPEFPTQTAR